MIGQLDIQIVSIERDAKGSKSAWIKYYVASDTSMDTFVKLSPEIITLEPDVR